MLGFSIAVGVVVGLFCFYVLYGIEGYLNGAHVGRHPTWFPFQFYLAELRQYLPGGLKRRTDFIRALIGDREGSSISGKSKLWWCNEVRASGAYQECALDVLGTGREFFTVTTLCFLVPALAATGVTYLLLCVLQSVFF